MTNASAAVSAVITLDDAAWDDLPSFIEERRFIPIVGPEFRMAAIPIVAGHSRRIHTLSAIALRITS